MHTRPLNAAALAAALTLPLVTVGYLLIVSIRRCRTEPGGPPCLDVWVADPDGSLWRAAVAAAVVELIIVGIRAVNHPATLAAVVVIALAITPVAAAADLTWLAVVSLACPLVIVAVRRFGKKRTAVIILVALLPSFLFLPLWQGLDLSTGYPLLLWMMSLPIALLK